MGNIVAMKERFSDRIGKTVPSKVLQTEGMNSALRNSLWNLILKTVFSGSSYKWRKQAQFLCENFFKTPIDRVPYDSDAREYIRNWFYSKETEWFHIYNFIEFIMHNIRTLTGLTFTIEKFEVQLNSILKDNLSGYRSISGYSTPITSTEEVAAVTKAIESATTRGFSGVKAHLNEALSLLAKKPEPDFRNSIKESISAVESLTKLISGEEGGGLEKALKIIGKDIPLHGALRSGILNLYGYTSNEEGIRHAILKEPNVGLDEAKFMLIICSAFVNFLIVKADKVGLFKAEK